MENYCSTTPLGKIIMESLQAFADENAFLLPAILPLKVFFLAQGKMVTDKLTLRLWISSVSSIYHLSIEFLSSNFLLSSLFHDHDLSIALQHIFLLNRKSGVKMLCSLPPHMDACSTNLCLVDYREGGHVLG